MKILDATVSVTNKPLANLQTKDYGAAKNVPLLLNEVASTGYRTVLSGVYQALSGNELAEDAKIGSVAVANGGFKKLYGPCLCTDGKQVILYIADQEVVVPAAMFKGTSTEVNGKPVEIEAGFLQYNLTGLGDELCVKFDVYFSELDVLLTLVSAVRVKDWKNAPSEADMNAYAKRGYKNLVAALNEVPKSSFFDGPTYKLSQLVVGQEYRITEYRGFLVGDRASYIMTGAPVKGNVYLEDPLKRENELAVTEVYQVWANKSITQSLSHEPVITPEEPARLIIRKATVRKDGKVNMDATLIVTSVQVVDTNEEEIEFDF